MKFFLLLLLFYYSVYSDIPKQWYLKNKVFISNNYITLFDIVKEKKDIQNIKILTTPESPILLNAEELSVLLEDTEYNYPIAGRNCLVIPLNKEFTSEEIAESLQKEILIRNKVDETDFKLNYIGKSIFLPGKGVEYRWGNFSKSLRPGRIIFPLDIYWKNSKIFSKKLSFVLEKKHKAMVSTQFISKGSIIKPTNYQLQEIYSADWKTDFITESLEGYTALTDIQANLPIRLKNVKKLYTIEKGAIILAKYEKGNLSITTRCRAVEPGNIGDIIKARFIHNQKILYGEVVDPETIRIK